MTSSIAATSVRPPAVAGSFYPGSPSVLRRDIDGLLEQASVPKIPGSLLAVLSPHAGYMYSGCTAAHSYKLLKGKGIDKVIIVGPSHRDNFDGISIYPGESYQTPLGNVRVNDQLRSQMISENKEIVASPVGHRTEHSVEVQLPFLQCVLERFTFVPVVMGDQTVELCRTLADAIAAVATDHSFLLVASSDLSHYHPYNEAVVLDQRVIHFIETYDELGLMKKLERHEVEACGGGPIVAIMLAAKKLGATNARVIHYCNSGDVTGEKDAVVGYCSAAFTRELSGDSHRVN
jgi:AmmeMemoRadiSam system protein B